LKFSRMQLENRLCVHQRLISKRVWEIIGVPFTLIAGFFFLLYALFAVIIGLIYCKLLKLDKWGG